MSNPQLLEYINSQLTQNISENKIKSDLLVQGNWISQDIDQAFLELVSNEKIYLPLTTWGVIGGLLVSLIGSAYVLQGTFRGSVGPEAIAVPFLIIFCALLGGGIGKAWGSRWGRIVVIPTIAFLLFLILGVPFLVSIFD